jgi:hypothetical protein
MSKAEELGYCTFAARGSRGPIDVVCFQQEPLVDWPDTLGGVDRILRPLAVQVGTANKGISRVLEALEDAPRPIGSRIMVARRIKAKNGRISWKFSTVFGDYTELADAIK